MKKIWVAAVIAFGSFGIACGDITAESPEKACESDEDFGDPSKASIERAATFAIRAGGSAGFLDEGPTFRDYVATEETENGYTASFEPELTVDLVLADGVWRIARVEGVIDEEACFTLLGYDEEDSTETDEHEFLNVRLRAENKRAAIYAALIGSPMWRGEIPYEGYRSLCYAAIYDEDGEPMHRTRAYPIAIPKEETDRTTGTTSIRVPGDKEAASGEFICETVPRASR